MALHDLVQWANLFYQGMYLADRVTTMARRPRIVPSAARAVGGHPASAQEWRQGAHRMISRAHSLLDVFGHDDD